MEKINEKFLGDKCFQQANYILINVNSFSELLRVEQIEKAIYFYEKAVKHYKLINSYHRLAEIYIIIAELKLEFKYGCYLAANNYLLAAKLYLKFDISMSIIYYKVAIELFIKDGKFSASARIFEKLAVIYYKYRSILEAIISYEKAVEYYEMDDSITAAYRCLLKITYLLISIKKYKAALRYLEKLIKYASTGVVYKINN